ncbi:hypothetical protein ACE6H2_001784 [Prunus campanulata]
MMRTKTDDTSLFFVALSEYIESSKKRGVNWCDIFNVLCVDFSGIVDDEFLENLGLEKGIRNLVNHEERGRDEVEMKLVAMGLVGKGMAWLLVVLWIGVDSGMGREGVGGAGHG